MSARCSPLGPSVETTGASLGLLLKGDVADAIITLAMVTAVTNIREYHQCKLHNNHEEMHAVLWSIDIYIYRTVSAV